MDDDYTRHVWPAAEEASELIVALDLPPDRWNEALSFVILCRYLRKHLEHAGRFTP